MYTFAKLKNIQMQVFRAVINCPNHDIYFAHLVPP